MESSDDEKLESSMTSNETQKAQDVVWNEGYREGKDEGRKEGFQKGFDLGYEDAVQHSITIGMFAGMIDALVLKDKTLKTFLEPLRNRITARIDQRGSLIRASDKMETETDYKNRMEVLRQETVQFIGKIEEDFVNMYPYGEEEAKKLVDSVLGDKEGPS